MKRSGLTGGTAAAQVSASSLPPSAPAAATSPPKGAAPPDAPRSPGNALVSLDDAAGVSWDTDMASSAVVAAAGERVSPILGGGQRRETRGGDGGVRTQEHVGLTVAL